MQMDYWWGLPSLRGCERRSSNESWTSEFNRRFGGVSSRKAARPVLAEDSLDTIETLELHHLKADVVAMRLLANTSRMSTSSPGQ